MQRHSSTRRRFLLGTFAAVTTLAGCLGSSAPVDETDPEDDSDGSTTPTTTATTTPSATPTPPGVCAPLIGETTPTDVAGTPYVFAWDHPAGWTVEEPLDRPGRQQRVESPPVTIDGEGRTATVRVSQSFEGMTTGERDDHVSTLKERDTEPYTEVDEQPYDGEALTVYGLADVSEDVYPPVYLLYIPHGSGDQRHYYVTTFVTFSDIYGLDDEEQASCTRAITEAALTIRESLRPNPETTIDEV